MATTQEREHFWDQVTRGERDACWEWTGKKIRGGYGDFVRSVDGKWTHTIAHRFAWIEANGPIPDGMLVCHRCDNPPCVNPAHLFLGTYVDNERDKIAKGRRPSTAGEASGTAVLTRDQVEEIRRLVNECRMTRGEVAARFGVDRRHVGRIAAGGAWRSVALAAPPARGRPGRPRGSRRPRDVSNGITCGRCREMKPCSEYPPSAVARGSGYCRACFNEWRRGKSRRPHKAV